MFINGKEFLTVRDMAKREEKTSDSIKKLLHRYNLRPISKDALYPIESYEIIKKAPPPGRPKKPASETHKPKKARKTPKQGN